MRTVFHRLGVAAVLCVAQIVTAAPAPKAAPSADRPTQERGSEADAKALEALPESVRRERRLRSAPEDLSEHLDAAEAYLAEAPESASKLEAAREHVSVVLRSQPHNVRALLLAGRIAILRGEVAQAQLSYLAAVKADPGNAQAYLGLGEAYSRLKDDVKATAAYAEYRRLIGLRPVEANNDAVRRPSAGR